MALPEEITFSFGTDRRGLRRRDFNEALVVQAQQELLDFLGMADLRGLRFIDVGCGTGLLSLAACRAGASEVVSLDIDPFQTQVVEKVRECYGGAGGWTIVTGSILDPDVVGQIDKGDIVYAWNSLDQTGRLWAAIQNAAGLAHSAGALMCLGVLATTELSPWWTRLKKTYAHASGLRRRVLELDFALKDRLLAPLLPGGAILRGGLEPPTRHPGAYWRRVRRWLGAARYEHARPEEIIRHCQRQMDWRLVNLDTSRPVHGYLFRRGPGY